MNNDRSIGALETTHSHLKGIGNSTDEMVRPQSLMSNQSDDIKAIRNSTSAQVQVLKGIAQGFAISSAQFMFMTLVVFLLCVTLIIYGLRLTLGAPKQTSKPSVLCSDSCISESRW